VRRVAKVARRDNVDPDDRTCLVHVICDGDVGGVSVNDIENNVSNIRLQRVENSVGQLVLGLTDDLFQEVSPSSMQMRVLRVIRRKKG
jgi:hypothetical protein